MMPAEAGWEQVGQGLPLIDYDNKSLKINIKLYIILLLLLYYDRQK